MQDGVPTETVSNEPGSPHASKRIKDRTSSWTSRLNADLSDSLWHDGIVTFAVLSRRYPPYRAQIRALRVADSLHWSFRPCAGVCTPTSVLSVDALDQSRSSSRCRRNASSFAVVPVIIGFCEMKYIL